MLDVIIVGAGPAGLSAALVLGRCRRRVLVCDAGRPRNMASAALHGFLSRDGIAPLELLRIGRAQLAPYETVEVVDAEAIDGRRMNEHFEIELADHRRYRSRMLLLSTGVVDELPPVPGIEAFYGRSVFHCPYCDGWERRDQPWAVYCPGSQAAALALELTLWTRDLALCTDGHTELSDDDREQLSRRDIGVYDAAIAGLEGQGGLLERITFADGRTLERRALFFSTRFRQRSELALALGCDLTQKGAVETGEYQTTHLPGLFVAGDASRKVQMAIVAAAEGAQAAFAINTALLQKERG
jgi:thioredoxin reductase